MSATCHHCPAPAGRPADNCLCCCHRAVAEAAHYRRMSRADRRMNMCLDSMACDDGGEHNWQPVSFVFESQLLDDQGRVLIRQPGINEGRVYVVCMQCRAHTYVVTEWVGYYLGGPDLSALDAEDSSASG